MRIRVVIISGLYVNRATNRIVDFFYNIYFYKFIQRIFCLHYMLKMTGVLYNATFNSYYSVRSQ